PAAVRAVLAPAQYRRLTHAHSAATGVTRRPDAPCSHDTSAQQRASRPSPTRVSMPVSEPCRDILSASSRPLGIARRWHSKGRHARCESGPCSRVSVVCGLRTDGSQHARAECAAVCSGCSARCLPLRPTRLGLRLRALGTRHIVRLAALSWSFLWRSQHCLGLVLRLDESPRAGHGYAPTTRR